MAKVQKGKKRIGLTVSAAIVLTIGILILSIQITNIKVTGNERYTDQQIKDLLFSGQQQRNTAYCYFRDRLRPHEMIPFVEDYQIIFNGLTEIEVIIYEKNVVGYVSYMSSYMYFDKDGIVVESANAKVAGIPWVTGLKFGQIVLYQSLPVTNSEIFGEILNLTQILSIYDLDVDQIQYNNYGEATLHMDELEILLGSNEGLNGKIAELSDMLSLLEGRAGTLHLEAYDETDLNTSYRFKPKEE